MVIRLYPIANPTQSLFDIVRSAKKSRLPFGEPACGGPKSSEFLGDRHIPESLTQIVRVAIIVICESASDKRGLFVEDVIAAHRELRLVEPLMRAVFDVVARLEVNRYDAVHFARPKQ